MPLGMTGSQMGRRLNISQLSVNGPEQADVNGSSGLLVSPKPAFPAEPFFVLPMANLPFAFNGLENGRHVRTGLEITNRREG
jgi:hypothetical protein